MSTDKKHIQELVTISKDHGKEMTWEEASVELERMRSIANIIIDTVMKMTPEERKALEQKIQKEKLNGKSKGRIKL